ncbi:diphthine--ammonia ligase [Ihubacter sp. rT4E-8]|uniref:Dph6-related ATP pyrophosphatase n=1 Tax=Ihubacter sp. rT4E-8 TaxID=3242369 RepID=UPI003CF23EA6
MKFVMSYSCGKDSTLALQTLIEEGHEPVALLIMVNEDLDRSWFHGADRQLLDKISEALDLPLILCPSKGEAYQRAFEEGLEKAKAMGAEMAGFGDIDIDGNRQWSEDRCRAVGIEAAFPLWQRKREVIVRELIAKGYQCVIKSINAELIPKVLLGRILDEAVMGIMEASGIDVCGENGEYHTLAVDGPAFRHPVSYEVGEIETFENRAIVEIR